MKTVTQHLPADAHCVNNDDEIRIYDHLTYRYCVFGAADWIQSKHNRDNPASLSLEYQAPLLRPLNMLPSVQRVLLIGLGGGTVVHYLQRFYPNVVIDVIELSSKMITLASTFFDIHPSEFCRIRCEDGIDYLAHTTAGYDIVILDVATQDGFVEKFGTVACVNNCLNALNETGALTINYCGNEPLGLLQTIRECFDQQTIAYPIKGYANTVISGFKGLRVVDALKHAQLAEGEAKGRGSAEPEMLIDMDRLSFDTEYGFVVR